MKAILFLQYRQIVNHIRSAIKSPKKLIPWALFAFWVFNPFLRGGSRSTHGYPAPSANIDQLSQFPPEVMAQVSAIAWSCVFALILLATILYVLKAFSESPLVFSLSEIDTALPTPISRRTIMLWKMVCLYAKTLGWLIYFGFFFLFMSHGIAYALRGSLRVSPLAPLAVIVMFSTAVINVSVIVNLISSYRPGGKWWLASAVRVSAAALPLAFVLIAGMRFAGTGLVVPSLIHATHNPVFTTLLLPISWTTDLVLTPLTGWSDLSTYKTLVIALLSAGTLIMAVSRHENPFEPSLEISSRRAAALAAMRSGDLGGMRGEIAKRFTTSNITTFIPPFARGAWSILWKDMVISLRGYGIKQFGVLLLISAVALIPRLLITESTLMRAGSLISTLVTGIFIYLIWMGSMVVGMALKLELKHANLMKPMPIPSWQILCMETASIVVQFTLAAWFLSAIVMIAYHVPFDSKLGLFVMIVPFVIALSTSAQLPIIPFFSGASSDQAQQQIVAMLSMLASAVSLGVPVGVSMLLGFLKVGVVPTAAAIALISSGITVGWIVLGKLAYDRYDPSDE